MEVATTPPMNAAIAPLVEEVMQPPSLGNLVCLFLGAGAAFSVLERLFPAAKPAPVRPGLGVDLIYWLITPLVTKSITGLVLVVIIEFLLGLLDRPFSAGLMDGFGPIAAQPAWLQLIEMLLAADLLGYATHRWLHTSWLWRFHAVHHSPRFLDWLSAYRMHPLDDVVARVMQAIPLLLAGFSLRAMAAGVPFLVVYVVFLHANVNWTFGPFRFVLASPTFHRWHHTSEQEGIDRNFATIFPIWDLLFGTFYLPRRQPQRYGVKDGSVPESFVGQILHPFVWRRTDLSAANISGASDSSHIS
jgi:sterol desaturase/sphingolipid hydroxylase (fatty acid hydroxylase superfamily)